MAGIIKNHKDLATERETYATKHLPVELAEKVLALAEEFLAALGEMKVSTHPGVRVMTGNIEAGATLIRAELAADGLVGTEDEIDAWQRAGIVPKSGG
jgi:hypothetical protein